MSSQSTLWLYPLVLMAALALVMYVRMGVRWTWGFCLQALTILGVGVCGLVFKSYSLIVPALNVTASLSSVCAVIGWLLFFGLVVVPRAIVGRLEHNLRLLAPDAAVADGRVLRWFFWGPPGRFWHDMAVAMSLFMKGKAKQAEAIIALWREKPLPKSTRQALDGYLLSGRVIMRDWNGILAELVTVVHRDSKSVPEGVITAASRAFLELGMIPEAVDCLDDLLTLNPARLTPQNLDAMFLPVFSLCGAEKELDALLERMSRGRAALPVCARFYWAGRCLQAQGRVGEARSAFDKARKSAPGGTSAWPERIEYQLSKLDGVEDFKSAADWSAEIARASALIERARRTAEIISPERPGWAVVALVSSIACAYAISHLYMVYKAPETLIITLSCFKWGVLDADLVKTGEYWRMVSYLFLHSHISHLALNLIGLWWFGRLTEKLYGTGRFLFIYFSSGILSGVAHLILSPAERAIGASGAVMGVFGAATAGIFRSKKILPDAIRRTEVSWMLGLAASQVVLDQIIPHVAVFAHLGGLVAGLVLGLVLPMRKLNDHAPAASRPENRGA